MIDWKKLCEESHANAKAKGFLDGARTFDGDVGLFHSELSEALEEYRAGHALDKVYYKIDFGEPPPGVGPMSHRRELFHQLNLHLNNQPTLEAYLTLPIEQISRMKPEGVSIELADYVIRVAQFCGTVGLPLAEEMSRKAGETSPCTDMQSEIAWLHYATSMFWFSYTQSTASMVDGGVRWLGRALHMLVVFCDNNKIDLEKAIQAKALYNATRGHKHGGKKI